jgi:hypothetical protein
MPQSIQSSATISNLSPASIIASVGQTGAHSPQDMQSSLSIMYAIYYFLQMSLLNFSTYIFLVQEI